MESEDNAFFLFGDTFGLEACVLSRNAGLDVGTNVICCMEPLATDLLLVVLVGFMMTDRGYGVISEDNPFFLFDDGFEFDAEILSRDRVKDERFSVICRMEPLATLVLLVVLEGFIVTESM